MHKVVVMFIFQGVGQKAGMATVQITGQQALNTLDNSLTPWCVQNKARAKNRIKATSKDKLHRGWPPCIPPSGGQRLRTRQEELLFQELRPARVHPGPATGTGQVPGPEEEPRVVVRQ